MSAVAVLLALFALGGTQSPPRPAEAARTPASTPARKAPKPAPPPVTSLDVAVADPAASRSRGPS